MVRQLAAWVHNEDFADWDSDFFVAHSVSLSVAKASVEGIYRIWEQMSYVLETGNLEHLGLLMDQLSFERVDEAVRGGQDRSFGQELLVLL